MAKDDDSIDPPKKPRPKAAREGAVREGDAPKPKKAKPVAKAEPKAAPKPAPTDDDEEKVVAEGGEDAALEPMKEGAPLALPPTDAAAREEDDGEEGEGEVAAAQLGSHRYVMAGFFAAAIIGSFVLAKILHALWGLAAGSRSVGSAVPFLVDAHENTRAAITYLVGGVVAIGWVVRAYRKPDVKLWSADVASELSKVKWPTRKDVSNSTIVVIAASAIATLYLALLDRFWAFVTNLVYGTGT